MKLKRNIVKICGITCLFFVIGISLISIMSSPKTAFADVNADGWCNNGSMNLAAPTDTCVDKVFNNIPNKQGLTQQQFLNLAQSCQNSSGGIGVHEGACVNATAFCLGHAASASECSNAPLVKAIADNCNNGEGGDSAGCTEMVNANQDQFRSAYQNAMTTASNACTVDPNSQASSKNACMAKVCDQSLSNSFTCTSTSAPCQSPLNSGSYWSTTSQQTMSTDLTNYQNCINNAVKNNAQGQPACNSVGGIYTTSTTGTGGNTVRSGCHANYSDLINADACRQGGGIWTQIKGANTPTTADDVWQCNPPLNKNNDNTSKSPNPLTQAVIPSLQQCGSYVAKGARPEVIQTNLISCNTSDQGIAVIGDVLRFGVTALTVLVGAGAVAGIAWEALKYARAQDNQSLVSEARTRIRDIIIGLGVYIFMVAIINWLVPGGIIGG